MYSLLDGEGYVGIFPSYVVDSDGEEDTESLIDITTITNLPRKALRILQNVTECRKLVCFVKKVSFRRYINNNRSCLSVINCL